MKKNRDECEMNGVDKRNEIMKDQISDIVILVC